MASQPIKKIDLNFDLRQSVERLELEARQMEARVKIAEGNSRLAELKKGS